MTPPADTFQKDLAPKLKLGVKNTTKRVNFSWKQIPGADGYKIYQYQEDTGKYIRIKTISKGDQITYSRKMEYGTWNQTVPADGYQVFQSKKKNGTYTRLKTIKKGDQCKYTIKNQPQAKMFYKVRAFVVKADGSRKFGAFSGAKAVIR